MGHGGESINAAPTCHHGAGGEVFNLLASLNEEMSVRNLQHQRCGEWMLCRPHGMDRKRNTVETLSQHCRKHTQQQQHQQQPTTTHNNNNSQQPTTTHSNPQQPTTTHNNPQQPTATHNPPQHQMSQAAATRRGGTLTLHRRPSRSQMKRPGKRDFPWMVMKLDRGREKGEKGGGGGTQRAWRRGTVWLGVRGNEEATC